jgi:hypothetical protein
LDFQIGHAVLDQRAIDQHLRHVAYSVFTHLHEQVAAHWMREIKRVLKPEGRIVFTALTARAISGYASNISTFHLPHGNARWQMDFQTAASSRHYEGGKFIYTTGSGSALTPTSTLKSDRFGWAAVPPNIIRNVWSLRIEQAHDDGIRFLHGVFIASPMTAHFAACG